MKFANFHGNSLHLTPQTVDFHNQSSGDVHRVDGANKVYFFTNISRYVPSDLFNVMNETQLLDDYSSELLGYTDGFGLQYTYDKSKKQRSIIQKPIDARPFTSTSNGIIEWCAIRVSTVGDNDFFIFTDKVSSNIDVMNHVLVQDLNCVQNELNYLNNISIITRDKSSSEMGV